MRMKPWAELPPEMQNGEVQKYYDILKRKGGRLLVKRAFDIVVSFLMLVVIWPVFLILALVIKLDSKGPVFYRQARVTQFGKIFHIHKFRSMVQGADTGSQMTLLNDTRVTRVGKWIRRTRLDELGQLIDVFKGDMTFVGTRPEVPYYVEHYTPEMMATLLMPAGVTSEASICYKDEAELLEHAEDVDKAYVEEILPKKMHYNLLELTKVNLWHDIIVMVKTVLAVFGITFRLEEQ